MSDNNPTPEEMAVAREALKKRFEKKDNKSVKKTPSPANKMMEKQMQSIRENPLFENLKNMNMDEIKKIIEGIACKMTADSKQKKNIKKQMCELIEKIKVEDGGKLPDSTQPTTISPATYPDLI
jgi:hypothetical protein